MHEQLLPASPPSLREREIGPAGTEGFAGVLAQCPALAHLDLCCNEISPAGTDSLEGVLAKCAALAHLNLGLLAGVLVQCAALAHLNPSFNQIGNAGAVSFAGVLAKCAALAHLDLHTVCRHTVYIQYVDHHYDLSVFTRILLSLGRISAIHPGGQTRESCLRTLLFLINHQERDLRRV
jgi:hypothetical protein